MHYTAVSRRWLRALARAYCRPSDGRSAPLRYEMHQCISSSIPRRRPPAATRAASRSRSSRVVVEGDAAHDAKDARAPVSRSFIPRSIFDMCHWLRPSLSELAATESSPRQLRADAARSQCLRGRSTGEEKLASFETANL